MTKKQVKQDAVNVDGPTQAEDANVSTGVLANEQAKETTAAKGVEGKPVEGTSNKKTTERADPMAKAQEMRQKAVDARGFLRAKGVPDHLFDDATAIEEYEKYSNAANKGKDYVVDLEVKSHVNKKADGTAEVVKRGQFSTAEGDKVPHYKNKDGE